MLLNKEADRTLLHSFKPQCVRYISIFKVVCCFKPRTYDTVLLLSLVFAFDFRRPTATITFVHIPSSTCFLGCFFLCVFVLMIFNEGAYLT